MRREDRGTKTQRIENNRLFLREAQNIVKEELNSKTRELLVL
jgi:hypothetical protein